jgi:hypothetical protein
MPEVNFEWIKQQLEEAKAKVGSGNAAMALLEAWAKIPNLSESMSKEAVALFSKLALNEALSTPQVDKNEVWVQARAGQLVVGDEVRVATNAFKDATGAIHNGRRGKIIAIRYGDVIFKATDGKQPDLEGVHYSPDRLEKRVQ